MIVGLPRFVSVSGCSSGYQKEGGMLLIKPILEVHSADRTTESGPLGRLPLDSFSIPTSPKIYELRARYEARRATESDLKPPKPS
jgi:hypothetical protein